MKRGWSNFSALVLSGFFLAFLVFPLYSIFQSVGTNALGWTDFFDRSVLNIVRFTLKQSILSLVFSLILGIPLGVFLFRRGSPTSLNRFMLLFSMPTLTVAMAVSLALKSYGLTTLLFAHVWINAPWIAIRLSEGLTAFPESHREAARSLGANSFRIFWDLERPFLYRRVFLASIQVFSACVMSFILVLLLGGGPPAQTLETEIFSSVRIGTPDFARAAVFAIWQLILTLVPLILYFSIRKPDHEVVESPVGKRYSEKEGSKQEWWSLLIFLPFTSLFLSLEGSTFLDILNPESLHAFGISLLIAIGVAVGVSVLSLAISLMAGDHPWLSALYQIPAGVSALVLGLGFWLGYARWIDPFEGSFLAMVLIQVVLILPVGIRILLPLSRERNRSALDAARVMGARTFEAWHLVEWPRWKAPLQSLVLISILWSMGEIAAVSLFSSENLTTLPLLISRWMMQYRFDQALGLNLILLILGFVLFGLRSGKKYV